MNAKTQNQLWVLVKSYNYTHLKPFAKWLLNTAKKILLSQFLCWSIVIIFLIIFPFLAFNGLEWWIGTDANQMSSLFRNVLFTVLIILGIAFWLCLIFGFVAIEDDIHLSIGLFIVAWLISFSVYYNLEYDSYELSEKNLIIQNGEVIKPINEDKKYIMLKSSSWINGKPENARVYENMQGSVSETIYISTIEPISVGYPSEKINRIKVTLHFKFSEEYLLTQNPGDYEEIFSKHLDHELNNSVEKFMPKKREDGSFLPVSISKVKNYLLENFPQDFCITLKNFEYKNCPELSVELN